MFMYCSDRDEAATLTLHSSLQRNMASPQHDVTSHRLACHEEDSDDDDESWIPLEKQDDESLQVPFASRAASVRMKNNPTIGLASYRNNKATRSCPGRMTQDDLNAIQRRLENRKTLKESLVDHPIQRFYMVFLGHLCRELLWSCWTIPSIQTVGMVLIVVGFIIGVTKYLWRFWWFILCPRPALLLMGILIISGLYIFKIDAAKITNCINSGLAKSVAFLQRAVSYLDPLQVLRWSLLFLLFIPTLLEARIMTFLVSKPLNCTGTEILSIGTAVSIWMVYQHRHQKTTPRDATMSGMLVLYTCTWVVWLVAAFQSDRSLMDMLSVGQDGVPLLLWMIATGSLLLILSSQWRRDYHVVEYAPWLSSRAIRHALRLSLQDVLATLGERVQQDEMLQLVMIRWIVDYWSYTPPTQPTTSTPFVGASQDTNDPPTTTTSNAAPASTTTPPSESPSRQQQHQQQPHDLQWGELLPMLNMTTDQMESEIHSSSSPSRDQPQQSPGNSSPLDNLKDMLVGMDMDESAKPAVLAYKKAIETFPPSRLQAEIIAVACRCPSAMTLLWLLFAFSKDFSKDFSIGGMLSTVFLLSPFIMMEIIRVQEWAAQSTESFNASLHASQEDSKPASTSEATNDDALFSLLPRDMDAMAIVLSRDEANTMNDGSALIQVWNNICGSVGALETGLTAARCVQTTVVATEFAGNIASLAQFGIEISQRGWMFGLTTMAKEIFMLHYNEQLNNQQQSMGRSANDSRYTHAAIHAVQNGKVMIHNAGVLLDEQPEVPRVVLEAVTGFLTAIAGRGWLWGKDEDQVGHRAEVDQDNTDTDNLQKGEEVGEEVTITDKTSVVSSEQALPGEPVLSERKVKDDSDPPVSTEETTTNEQQAIFPEAAQEQSEESVADASLDAGDESAIPTEDDGLPRLLDSLADAYEREMISKEEKDTFMEMLSTGETLVVKNSLDCLFKEADLHSELQAATEAPPLTVGASQSCDTVLSNVEPLHSDFDEGEWKSLSNSQESLDGVNDCSHQATAALPVRSEDGVHCESFMAALAARSSVNRSLEQNETHPQTNAGEGEHEDPVPHWFKVAAGVGLGVFGGVAIVNASKGNDNERQESSSPIIEELPPFDDNESMDGWESLPRQE